MLFDAFDPCVRLVRGLELLIRKGQILFLFGRGVHLFFGQRAWSTSRMQIVLLLHAPAYLMQSAASFDSFSLDAFIHALFSH